MALLIGGGKAGGGGSAELQGRQVASNQGRVKAEGSREGWLLSTEEFDG